MSWLKKLKALWKKFYRFFEGAYRTGQLEDSASDARTDAEKAVARILRGTGIPPDCVGATVIQGGCAILITHSVREQKRQEAFVHKTYEQAADKALEWLEANKLKFGGQTGYNRDTRRAYKAKQIRALKAKRK